MQISPVFANARACPRYRVRTFIVFKMCAHRNSQHREIERETALGWMQLRLADLRRESKHTARACVKSDVSALIKNPARVRELCLLYNIYIFPDSHQPRKVVDFSGSMMTMWRWRRRRRRAVTGSRARQQNNITRHHAAWGVERECRG